MKAKWVILAMLALAAPVSAGPFSGLTSLPQLGLPIIDGIESVAGDTVRQVAQPLRSVAATASRLASARVERLTQFAQDHRDKIDFDDAGAPARRGEVLMLDPDDAALVLADTRGFEMIERGTIDGLEVRFARLAVPPGKSLASAIRDLRRALPDKEISSDPIHFASGRTRSSTIVAIAAPLVTGGTVGLIDGGVGRSVKVDEARGFATGAPHADAHGTAVASLLRGAGVRRIIAADVYGTEPDGGSALSLARAIGWMVIRKVPVVTISLVGPANPLLARVIAQAQGAGTVLVAAVGNDGPAAPPAYPASYPGVIAVTGVDGRNRALIEAGRAAHLDYAAPGADMVAMGLDGKAVNVRGTSFAAPLAAARLAALGQISATHAGLIAALDREAIDLGARGPDPRYGRGLVCGGCRTTR